MGAVLVKEMTSAQDQAPLTGLAPYSKITPFLEIFSHGCVIYIEYMLVLLNEGMTQVSYQDPLRARPYPKVTPTIRYFNRCLQA